MICYLSRNYKGLNSAGNKAKTDIERIMEELHYKNVGLKQTLYTNNVAAFIVTLMGILLFPFRLHKGDILILQYPLKKYYVYVCRMAHLRGCRVVTLIHDLGSFRRQKLTVLHEITRLNYSDYVIAHNIPMRNWLQEQGCKAILGELEIFDYLSEGSKVNEYATSQSSYKVLYAGALASRKNKFLYDLEDYINSYSFILYGNGFEPERIRKKELFVYKGFVPSEELIATAKGDFGLVWDGNSIESCTGNFGEYLQYNNPHKTSLYIRCGLPIIIWEKAALAPFIRENKIGFSIASLKQLNDILPSVSQQEYKEMKSNVLKIGERLSCGFYFSKAIGRAIESLK